MNTKALLTPFDRPNSYVGRTLSRSGARRAVAGRGRYTDDITLPRMVHAAFVRSPYAHAKVVGIDTDAAASQPGVIKIMTGAELAEHVEPQPVIYHLLPNQRATNTLAMATDRVRWVGQIVAAVVATDRYVAEDAVNAIEVEYDRRARRGPAGTSVPVLRHSHRSGLVVGPGGAVAYLGDDGRVGQGRGVAQIASVGDVA